MTPPSIHRFWILILFALIIQQSNRCINAIEVNEENYNEDTTNSNQYEANNKASIYNGNELVALNPTNNLIDNTSNRIQQIQLTTTTDDAIKQSQVSDKRYRRHIGTNNNNLDDIKSITLINNDKILLWHSSQPIKIHRRHRRRPRSSLSTSTVNYSQPDAITNSVNEIKSTTVLPDIIPQSNNGDGNVDDITNTVSGLTPSNLSAVELNQNNVNNKEIERIPLKSIRSNDGNQTISSAQLNTKIKSELNNRNTLLSDKTDDSDIIIIGEDEIETNNDNTDYSIEEPIALPLRPIIASPFDSDTKGEISVVYAEQHKEVKIICEADIDISQTVWKKDGQLIHAIERNSRPTDYRFIREPRGDLTIVNVMLEDDGIWQCEAETNRGYVENGRPVKLVVLDRPKPPYLLIDSRRLDAGNIFVPVKENSELNLACVSEGGNPKPKLSWEILLSPGIERHAHKVTTDLLELQEVTEKQTVTSSPTSVKSEARLKAVYRAHHNARILCVMEHPTLKMRQNASFLLDVQYTPSFVISRTPGFGYPLREGIDVSLKCDVDSNPPSTPLWQKDDGDTPIPQTGDGFLNFTSIRREYSGWYKCTSRHLNSQYSSMGYYLSIRYESVDVTSESIEPEVNMFHTGPQLEVQLGGAVTLQCPQGSLGCWSHLDPVTARLRGLGVGLQSPTSQFSLKDVVYQDAGTYKCIGQSPNSKKKLEIIQSISVQVKGQPTVIARNSTPIAYPGSPLHLSVEFCANPAAYAARWLHGDRVYTPGNQYGIDVLAYGVIDLPTPFCKEARLTYVHMHERVPRTFYFIVSSPNGVAEAVFHVNFTMKHKVLTNSVDDDEEELSEPEEIHFPVFGNSGASTNNKIFIKNSYKWTKRLNYNINLFKILKFMSFLLLIYASHIFCIGIYT